MFAAPSFPSMHLPYDDPALRDPNYINKVAPRKGSLWQGPLLSAEQFEEEKKRRAEMQQEEIDLEAETEKLRLFALQSSSSTTD